MSIHNFDQREGVVATLTKLLERAERGEINAIGVAVQVANVDIGTAYCFAGPHASVWTLLGAVRELDKRLLDHAHSIKAI